MKNTKPQHNDLDTIRANVRAANYLSAAQIYLQDNFLLQRPLTPEDIKPRLLGHWGTCPGINFTYAHLNRLITTHDADIMFVLGPGHGFPALQANLFIEGTLGKYYSSCSQDGEGVAHICRNFSWPYGFPSHSNPGTPGVILEGGELGYSLSTSYGAALDNPGLIVACLVGDGEAETGPTAAAWHANKLIDPLTNGTVLPILHLNGYKISGPTIFGRMSNHELRNLFYGYGYEPHIVEGSDAEIYEIMNTKLELCYETIRGLQSGRISDSPEEAIRLPMIILRTPKGWTGIKELHGSKIEGNYLSHQVVAPHAKRDHVELAALEKWLKSYRFDELFASGEGFCPPVLENVPDENKRMGDTPHARGGEGAYEPLKLPDAASFAEEVEAPSARSSSSMRRLGLFMNDVFKLNEENRNFRLMSPDETYSNKLDAVFDSTNRAFLRAAKPWDKHLDPAGRVMELLSEHTLQGFMQGYVLTGRHAVFASYEAFLKIVGSMVDQYAKFIRVARETEWRGDVPSLNYILTSSGWRQEHNGYSHQNPGFIDDAMLRQGKFVNVYFPPDANSALVCLKHMLDSRESINLLIAGKTLEPRWLTSAQAEKQFAKGLMIWDFASDDDPDIVFSAAGEYPTKEAMAAINIVWKEAPKAKVRFVSIMSLSPLGINEAAEHRLNTSEFESYFTADKPVIINFHGYPQVVKQVLFDYESDNRRFTVHGYEESGSTTTTFDMHLRNRTSRYHLAIEAFRRLKEQGVLDAAAAQKLVKKYVDKISHHREYVKEHGVDTPEVESWQWNPRG